jgi:hypothetical protein
MSSIALTGRYITAMGKAHGRKEDLTHPSPERAEYKSNSPWVFRPFRAEKMRAHGLKLRPAA